MDNVLLELVKITPSVLWFALIVILIIRFYHPFRQDILPKIKMFEAAGVKFTLVRDSIDAAIKLAEKSPQWKVDVSEKDKRSAEQRARANISVFKGSFILWVDDHPENNLNERKMFKALGADIDVALNTEDAIRVLENGEYDLVFSDMARGDDEQAGLDFLKQLREKKNTIPVIFYVGVIDPDKCAPDCSFGITNRPDELLHYTLDVLERKKY